MKSEKEEVEKREIDDKGKGRGRRKERYEK